MNFRALFLCLKPTQTADNFLFIFLIILISVFSLVNVTLGATLVNINTADATELDTIPEVGPSTATKIIAYREANGPFSVIEDIMKVTGIKEATFAKMKDYITVGSTSSGTEPDDDEEIVATSTTSNSNESATTTTTTISTSTEQIVYKYISVHSSSDDLSNYNEPSTLTVSAGRSRLSYVGMPVEFFAKIKATGDASNQNKKITWSFGDGSSDGGEKVTHIYKNSGIYNVVVNIYSGDITAVSRSTIKIIEPKVSLVEADRNNFAIKNFGEYEINLNNWSVLTQNSQYRFPLDTILSAGQTLTVPFEYSKLEIGNSENMVLFDPSRKQKSVLILKQTNNLNSLEVEKVTKLSGIYKTKKVEQNTITTSINMNIPPSNPVYSQTVKPLDSQNNKQIATVLSAIPSSINQVEMKELVVEETSSTSPTENNSESPGLLNKLISWPGRAVGSFIGFFYPGLNSSQ